MSIPICSDVSTQISGDQFLNHPKPRSSCLEIKENTDNGMDRVQELMQKRRDIEERTVNSSNRSLGLLYESERAGVAIAVELDRQKEQLKRTEERLDAIDSTLRTSERHLKGIKSLFGGIKNYVRSRNTDASRRRHGIQSRLLNASTSANGNTSSKVVPNDPYGSNGINKFPVDIERLDDTRIQNHPGLRTRGLHESDHKSVDAILDSNLDEMSSGICRLKELSLGLNRELEEHSDIIISIDDKTSNADWRVQKHNKDMSKLLNPKNK